MQNFYRPVFKNIGQLSEHRNLNRIHLDRVDSYNGGSFFDIHQPISLEQQPKGPTLQIIKICKNSANLVQPES